MKENNTIDELLSPVEYTTRGFQIIKFLDRYGTNCKLVQSSIADNEKPGSSAIWFGTEKGRMHLNRDTVKKLINTLKLWVRTGSFEKVSNTGELIENKKFNNLKNIVCPQCKKPFKLIWGTSFTKNQTLYIRECPSGGVYDVAIHCPNCNYEEEL